MIVEILLCDLRPKAQAERAGPLRAKGLRMDARRAKNLPQPGLVHDSRTPKGASPKASRSMLCIMTGAGPWRKCSWLLISKRRELM